MELAGVRVAICNWRDLEHSLAGGSEVYAWQLARALRDAGAAVEFVTSRDEGQSAAAEVEGISVHRRGNWATYILHTLWYLLRHRRRFDVVIDIETGIPVFARLVVSRRTAVMLIVHHVHLDQFTTYFPRPLAVFGRFLEADVMPWVYRRVPTYAVSESTRADMVCRLRWRSEIGILRNGSPPVPETVPQERRQPHRVVVLGRLTTHKRIDLVIRAVERLRAEYPDLTVDVIGKGPIRDELQELIDELGLNDVVVLHGFLPEEEKNDLLAEAGLHVCASDAEGWGQVVIEAAAYGVPTVARDVPGLRDSIQDGVTGFLLPDPGQDGTAVVDVLVEGIGHAFDVLGDRPTREQIGCDCREWAGRFSWERMHQEAVAAVVAVLRHGADRWDL